MDRLPDDHADSPGPGTPASAAGAATPAARGGLPDLSPVALVAGLLGLVTGPFLVDDPVANYVVLGAAVVALALGGLGVHAAVTRARRIDVPLIAVILGAVTFFLWVRSVVGLPQGGT